MATRAQVKEFIAKVAPIAQEKAKGRNKWSLPSVCIAQCCCESAYGTSQKMKRANALLGVKVGKNKVHFGKAWKDKAYSTNTKECYDGKTYVNITDMFRAYDSIADAIEDYYDMLASCSRYRDCLNQSDAKKCITEIKNGGYATAPDYVTTIMSIIRKNDLTQYDRVVTGITSVVQVEQEKRNAEKNMSIKIGSARIDENGKLSGGAAGDQTGKEVSTQDYYMHSKGWYLFRPKTTEDAEKIAAAMQSACDNANIGYDQGNRLDVITQIKRYGNMEKISVKTEADCSSLVRACCVEAGFDPGNFNTASEAAALEKTGRFRGKMSVTASMILYDGDILVTKTKGHTVVVVPAHKKAGKRQTLSVGSRNSYVTYLQKRLTAQGYGVGEIDGSFGQKTLEAVKAYQADYGLTVDGIVGAKTWASLVA